MYKIRSKTTHQAGNYNSIVSASKSQLPAAYLINREQFNQREEEKREEQQTNKMKEKRECNQKEKIPYEDIISKHKINQMNYY